MFLPSPGANLPKLSLPMEANEATSQTIKAFALAVEALVPISRLCKRSLPHFTTECKEAYSET